MNLFISAQFNFGDVFFQLGIYVKYVTKYETTILFAK